MRKIVAGVVGGLVALLAVAAANAFSLSGDASIVSPGNASAHAVQITSSSSGAGYGAVSFPVPAGMTVNDLASLGTDYMVVAGDCGGGSPRFSIGVDTSGDGNADGHIFVYIGPAPNYTNCPSGWQSTGDLLTGNVDASQLGGAFYDTMANVQSLIGTKSVVSISLVADGSWVTDPQTFDFDNVSINGTVYTFEPATPADKDSCKKGGWENLTRSDFSTFKNQGDCIQYVNTGK